MYKLPKTSNIAVSMTDPSQNRILFIFLKTNLSIINNPWDQQPHHFDEPQNGNEALWNSLWIQHKR